MFEAANEQQGCFSGCGWLPTKGFEDQPPPSRVGAVEDSHDITLARELNQLSFAEREKVFNEIHGVAEVPEETEDFLSEKFRQFDEAVDKIPKTKRKTLDRAFFLKPSLETDRKFHLRFLRADRFDAKSAARRFANYFESKLQLFGEEKLVKKITFNDLCEGEGGTEAVNSTFFHVLPEKDRAGRSVWFMAIRKLTCKSWKGNTKIFWYQVETLLEDEATQIHGVVDITYLIGMRSLGGHALNFVRKGVPLLVTLPFRLCGVHYCMSDRGLKPVVNFIQSIVGKKSIVRFRGHFGSSIEVRYALMTFGLPAASLPVNADGTLRNDYYFQRLEKRKQLERKREQEMNSREKESALVEYPTYKDVIVGRGKPYQEFPGNVALSRIVDVYRDQYHQADERFAKLCIVMDIIKRIEESGGRFLQRKDNGWEAASEKIVRLKVGAAMRSKRIEQKLDNTQSAYDMPMSKIDDNWGVRASDRMSQDYEVPSKKLRFSA